MNRYTWLLFDADGTLFDYDKAETFALQRSFQQSDMPFEPHYLSAYRRINHQIWIDFEHGKITAERLKTKRFELLFDELHVDVDTRTFSNSYLVNLSNATFLINSAEEIVKTLADMHHIAIITNGLTNVQYPRIKESVLASYIEVTIISEEVGVAKPDPQIFHTAFEQMRHPDRNEVLIIGDSLTSDMRGGHNYGIDTCWFNPKKLTNTSDVRPTYEIQHLSELLDILRRGETYEQRPL